MDLSGHPEQHMSHNMPDNGQLRSVASHQSIRSQISAHLDSKDSEQAPKVSHVNFQTQDHHVQPPEQLVDPFHGLHLGEQHAGTAPGQHANLSAPEEARLRREEAILQLRNRQNISRPEAEQYLKIRASERAARRSATGNAPQSRPQGPADCMISPFSAGQK